MAGEGQKEGKSVAVNRQARRDYDIEETFEAGIMLSGTEIKSVRLGRANLNDAFAQVEGGEIWLHNMHIPEYAQGNRYNTEPRRSRKLLMHRLEIHRLLGKTQTKGLTLVPLDVHLRNGYAKITLGLGRGKREYEKREAIIQREQKREIERAVRDRRRG
jgi:SsrA-binding protein